LPVEGAEAESGAGVDTTHAGNQPIFIRKWCDVPHVVILESEKSLHVAEMGPVQGLRHLFFHPQERALNRRRSFGLDSMESVESPLPPSARSCTNVVLLPAAVITALELLRSF
jgi:hypothetical protein